MDNTRIFKISFAGVYPLYIQKAEKKGRTKAEVDTIIYWLTSYDEHTLKQQIEDKVNLEVFFCTGSQNKPQCVENHRGHLWLSRGGDRGQTHAADPLPG